MPAPGWKTITVPDSVYEDLSVLADLLDRPINWTATRSIEYAVAMCLAPRDGVGRGLDRKVAEEFGLR